jgi:hypothetical protein
MEFERRTPLEFEQVSDALNREIHSVSQVGQAFRPQSEQMQSERRTGVSQLAAHANVGIAGKATDLSPVDLLFGICDQTTTVGHSSWSSMVRVKLAR